MDNREANRMLGLLGHMHVTAEAIRQSFAIIDTATLASWRPSTGATPASAETFLAALIAEELARRSEAKPRLTLVVDNKVGSLRVDN